MEKESDAALLVLTVTIFIVLHFLQSTTMAKKRNLSGLSSLELQLAYNSLLKLKNTFLYEESNDADLDEISPESFEQQIERILSLMKSKLETGMIRLIVKLNASSLLVTQLLQHDRG